MGRTGLIIERARQWPGYFQERLKARHWLVRGAVYGTLGILFSWLVLILAYSFINPPFSTLMAGQFVMGNKVRYQWVPLDKMSKHLPRAVVIAEDARYCQHWGVNWTAVEKAWGQAGKRRRPRGASTIPMQTVKNLFLWPSRSYVRKVIEVPLAYTASLFWSKRRLMEIYLNIVEWGPGIFGAEAAARHHFKKSASRLSRQEAALLAASLPNPYIRRAGRPGPKTRQVASIIEQRMAHASPWVTCLKK